MFPSLRAYEECDDGLYDSCYLGGATRRVWVWHGLWAKS